MELSLYLNENPVNRTYFAIGSCPHAFGEELTQKEDQLLPLFFREWIEQARGTLSFRAIHYDPAFKYHAEELRAYFETLGFDRTVNSPLPSFQTWRSADLNLEIFLFTDYFTHTTDGNFLQTIATNIQNEERLHATLVVQEYTGHDLDTLARKFYAASEDTSRFLQRILFDISYGADSGCMTDLTKYRPFTDAEGNFYNLLLLNPQNLYKLIGKEREMDRRILSITVHEYKKFLNTYHVDYRRILRGESALFLESNNSRHPDEIMSVLLDHLTILIQTLSRLRHISAEECGQFHTLQKEYRAMDVYKWYDAMSKLVPLVN